MWPGESGSSAMSVNDDRFFSCPIAPRIRVRGWLAGSDVIMSKDGSWAAAVVVVVRSLGAAAGKRRFAKVRWCACVGICCSPF